MFKRLYYYDTERSRQRHQLQWLHGERWTTKSSYMIVYYNSIISIVIMMKII